MKKLSLLLVLAVATLSATYAQEPVRFSVFVSTDSVLLGNSLRVEFKLENTQGHNFMAPELRQDFDVLSGPSTASSMRMVNGKTTQSTTYSYQLRPRDIGNYFIGPASVETDEGILETEPIEIMVVPNPDGVIQQQMPQSFGFHFEMPGMDMPNPMMPDSLDFFRSFGFPEGGMPDMQQLLEQFGMSDMMGDPQELFRRFGFEMPALPPQDSTVQKKKKRKIYKL